MENDKIDFVILWVDGKDKAWLEDKNRYSKSKIDVSNSIIRYRDWDNLKFWFRAVEKYAPWVNNIFFITYGHLPDWLNTENPKLKIINHKDFIPKEYLPTFNSNVIELNLFRIKELSEKFVLFNDDFFINNYVREETFFKNNLPCDIFINDIIMPNSDDLSRNQFNNEEIINKYFSKKDFMSKNLTKIFNLKYGRLIIRNFLLMFWGKYSTFKNLHLPQPFLKATFRNVWEKEYTKLNNTCQNKFRTGDDVTQYLIRDWQLASGNFYPTNANVGKYYNISNENSKLLKCISKGKTSLICMNDVFEDIDFERAKYELNKAFEVKYPQKSKFEK